MQKYTIKTPNNENKPTVLNNKSETTSKYRKQYVNKTPFNTQVTNQLPFKQTKYYNKTTIKQHQTQASN